MSRAVLPARRRNLTRDVSYNGRTYAVCIGFDDAGSAREVFASGERQGSEMHAFIADACIVVSIALQHGVTAPELARSLGMVPAYHGGVKVEAHASPIGAIVAAVIEGAG